MAAQKGVDLSPDKRTKSGAGRDEQELEARVLLGYLGKSDRPGCCRLYLTTQLDEYYDIRIEDVVRREKLPEKDAGLAETALHVRRDSSAFHVRSKIVDLQIGMLQGEITDALLAQVGSGNVIGWAIPRVAAQVNKERQSGGGFFCTVWSGCTEGKVGGQKCTHDFGPDDKFHVTRDRVC